MMKRFGLVALLLAAACSSTGNPQPPPDSRRPASPQPPKHGRIGGVARGYTGHGPKVVILGDSLTVLGWDDLYRALDRRFAVQIAALSGEGYNAGALSASAGTGPPALLKIAARYARSRPAVAVLAIGTNDALYARPVESALANMRTIVDGMRPACLVGVTLPSRTTAPGWSAAVADRLNSAMRSWADQIVDWATLSRRPGVLQKDGVHTKKAGTILRSNAIARAVQACKPAD